MPGFKPAMYPLCVIDDNVARIAVNIVIQLEAIGVTRVYAKNVAVDWLQQRCNIPRLIAFEVHNCLMGNHTLCSLGNKHNAKMCDIDHGSCNKWKKV